MDRLIHGMDRLIHRMGHYKQIRSSAKRLSFAYRKNTLYNTGYAFHNTGYAFRYAGYPLHSRRCVMLMRLYRLRVTLCRPHGKQMAFAYRKITFDNPKSSLDTSRCLSYFSRPAPEIFRRAIRQVKIIGNLQGAGYF